jgi:hypothetical protein
MAEAELGARLAKRVDGVVAHRQRQNVIVVALGFVEFSECEAFVGKRRTVGDRVGDVDLLGKRAVAFARIKCAGEARPRPLRLGAAEPFRHQLDHHINQRSDGRQQQDDQPPGHEAAGLRRMDDENDFNDEQDQSELHRSPRNAKRPPTEQR